MRRKFVAGNWKMNLMKASAVELAKAVARGVPDGVDVGVAVPFVYIDAVGQALAGSKVLLGAQDAYCESFGALTGEICVEQLVDLGVKFCLTGHSERRHVLKETPDLISRKAHKIYGAGLILIHCVGEKLQERDAGQTLAVCEAQLRELRPSEITDPNRLVIAYEPVWAIGTGRNATEQQAEEVHAFIRKTIAAMWNKEFANRVRIQYGGSMKPENARALLSQPDVDGGLIGGAALKADSFLPIVKATAEVSR
jgi:triosephosphate isomerase (TIM)